MTTASCRLSIPFQRAVARDRKFTLAQQGHKRYCDAKLVSAAFVVNDQLVLSTSGLNPNLLHKQACSVFEHTEEVAYKLDLPDNSQIYYDVILRRVSLFVLKRCSGGRAQVAPLCEVMNSMLELEVERILKNRTVKRGCKTKVEHLLNSCAYCPGHNVWQGDVANGGQLARTAA